MHRLSSKSLILSLLALFALVAVRSVAQEPPNRLSIHASGYEGPVQVQVYLLVGGELPSEWVGWVVDRTQVGTCDAQTAQLGTVMSFPAGEQTYYLPDSDAEPGSTYQYRFYAVDGEGTRIGVPHGLFSHSTSSAFGSVSNSGLVGVGYVVDFGWYFGLVACPQECWGPLEGLEVQPLGFLSGIPMPIKVFGEVGVGIEGPYLEQLASWEFIDSCDPVSVENCTWGNVKAVYR